MTGLQSLRIRLRGYGDAAPLGTSFFDVVDVKSLPDRPLSPGTSAWQAAHVELFSIELQQLSTSKEPTEEFAIHIARGFEEAAAWLNACDPANFEGWRHSGKKADIFVGGWLKNDQFDLSIPPKFLVACGRLSLPLEICTND